MQAYRCVWMRVTVVVLASGAMVLAGAWAVVSPRSLAVALACGWLAKRLAGRTSSPGPLFRGWLQLAGTPPQHDAATARGVGLLVGFLVSAVGWHLLLGGAGTALVLVDALLGLPLLVPSGVSLESEFEELEVIHEPAPGSSGDVLTVTGEPDHPSTAATGFSGGGGPRTLLPGLSDTELWHAWRASACALRAEPDPAARLRIVAARSHYLDALAERDPEWMARQLSMDGSSGWASFDPPT